MPTNYLKPIIAALLIATQAILLNNLVVKHKLSRALSTIPAALFVLYACFALESEIFHPALVANLFALLSLGSLFKIYKKHAPVATIFNSGFYMTMAAVFYPPYVVYLVLLILGLFSLRNLSVKESLQLLLGSLAPFYLGGVYFYFSGKLPVLVEHFYMNLSLPWRHAEFSFLSLIKVEFVLIVIMALIFFSNNAMKKKKYDAIKKIELSYWMLLLSTITVFLSSTLSEGHLLVASIPIGIISGLYMESKPNAIIKAFLFILLIASFVAFQLQVV